MSISFSDVARALDDLVEMEEGVRSERLCVALARRRISGLIATESKKDGGEDAIFFGQTTSETGVPGVAVSITNTLDKVKGDAKTIKRNGVKIAVLYFYTPRKVANTTARAWAKEIFTDFGHELVVISREDIVHSLLEPDNTYICQSYLGLDVARPQDFARIIPGAAAGALEVTAQWLSPFSIDADRLIQLKAYRLDEQHDRAGDAADVNNLKSRLANSERLTLIGGPGAGKSTALSMLSVAMLGGSDEIIPLLVSVPEFIDARVSILDYVAAQPAFRSNSISVDDLTVLAVQGQVCFLLNGWNEVGIEDSERANRELRKISREFPGVGLLVSSRPQKVDPFNGSAVRYELAGVSDSQREAYVRVVCPEKEKNLLHRLEINDTLNSLSRSPFILEQLVTLYAEDESLPDTKAEVLASIIRSTERNAEHVSALASDPLLGNARSYLEALAVEMTTQGRVSISESRACNIINAVGERLAANGQDALGLRPKNVVRSLCAHHLLEEIAYPEVAFRFSHQQFQEKFGADALHERVTRVIEENDGISSSLFQSEIIDIPVWEESLLLLAEERGAYGGNQAEIIVTALVEWTTTVDPVFAARLYAISGNLAEQVFTDRLEPLLRRWYGSDSLPNRTCAVAAMVATRSDRFAEILWSLLDSPDRDIRVTALDVAGPIPTSVLGKEWKARVASWSPERRSEFIYTVGHSGSKDGVELAYRFAISDPDPSVCRKAIDVLWFRGSRAKLIDVIRQSRNDVFGILVKNNQLPQDLPSDLLVRRDSFLARLIEESEEPEERIRLAARVLDTNWTSHIEKLKTDMELVDLSQRDHQMDQTLFDLVQKIRPHDEAWVVQWIAQRAAAGELLSDEWSRLGELLDSSVLESVLRELVDPAFEDSGPRRYQKMLPSSVDVVQIDMLLNALASTHQKLRNSPHPQPENLRNCYFRIRDLLFDIPAQELATAVSKRLSTTEDSGEILELLELLGVRQVGDFDGDTAREDMDSVVLDQLRQTLRKLVPVVDTIEDSDGEFCSRLATALGRYGAIADVRLLHELINIDVERVNLGRELFRVGKHQDPRASGSRVRHDRWTIGALINLAGQGSEDILLGLLEQPDYEDQAARGLFKLVRLPSEEDPLFRRGVQDYRVAADLQVVPKQRFSDEEKRQVYAEAVRQHLNKIIALGADDPAYPAGRLKKIASSLSLFGRPEDVQLILEQLGREGKWDAWVVVDTIEYLVFTGLKLSSRDVMKTIDPIVTRMVDNTEWYKPADQAYILRRCITILLLGDEPNVALELLSTVYPSMLRQYDLGDIVEIAGCAKSEELDSWRAALLRDPDLESWLAGRIMQSLAKSNGSTSEAALLANLGLSDAEPIVLEMKRETIEPYAASVASAIERDSTLQLRFIARCSENLDQNQKNIMATVVEFAKIPELDIAALQLIRDVEEIPWSLRKRIKSLFYEEVEIPGRQGWFEINPIPDTSIRPRLLDMAYSDTDRKEKACDLLGQIEKWRTESGRPAHEPRHPHLSGGRSWPVDLVNG